MPDLTRRIVARLRTHPRFADELERIMDMAGPGTKNKDCHMVLAKTESTDGRAYRPRSTRGGGFTNTTRVLLEDTT